MIHLLINRDRVPTTDMVVFSRQDVPVVFATEFYASLAECLYHGAGVQFQAALWFFGFGELLREPGEEDAVVRLVEMLARSDVEHMRPSRAFVGSFMGGSRW